MSWDRITLISSSSCDTFRLMFLTLFLQVKSRGASPPHSQTRATVAILLHWRAAGRCGVVGDLTTWRAPKPQWVLRPLCRAGNHCPLPRSLPRPSHDHPAAPTWKGAAYWEGCHGEHAARWARGRGTRRSGCPRERRLAVSPGETLPRVTPLWAGRDKGPFRACPLIVCSLAPSV